MLMYRLTLRMYQLTLLMYQLTLRMYRLTLLMYRLTLRMHQLIPSWILDYVQDITSSVNNSPFPVPRSLTHIYNLMQIHS
ncbi:hypothetical protein NIES4106_37030 [Fischerella sp. NIES-4106]|nr:hypothetical protein NIES4106_37030 [Fischerella sp. NIES-4106]